MSAQLVGLIIAIVQLVLEHGPEAVQKAMVALGKDEITLEDIQALRELIKPPEEY